MSLITRTARLVLVFFALGGRLFLPSLAERSTGLGCGDDRETGEPQATAHVEFGGDAYQNGTLFLVIDWGDGHGFRQTYNLTEIHGTRLDFVHNYENATDPDNWSYSLLLHADVQLPNQDDLLLWRTEITCGATNTPATAPRWKSLPRILAACVILTSVWLVV